jgi:putative ABC transport system permease protein
VLLLPPWTRAPMLGMRSPAVVLAVLAASAILACASASAALFLSSASTEALHRIAAADCPDATFPAVTTGQSAGVSPTREQAVSAAMTGAGLAAPYQVRKPVPFVPGQPVGLVQLRTPAAPPTTGQVFFRPGAADNVTVLSRGSGTGLWLTQEIAGQLHARAGGQVRVGTSNVPVAGIYKDLGLEPTRPYWCSYATLYNGLGNDVQVPLLIASDLGTYDRVQAAAGFQSLAYWVSPINPDTLTRTSAQRFNAANEQAYRTIGFQRPGDLAERLTGPGQLPDFTGQAGLIRGGLRGPVVPIALGGSILALLLVGAAGSYWADRRYREVRLLSARGVGPTALAGKALLELAAPAIVGTALGWLLARWLVGTLGPTPRLDPAAPWQAAATTAVALVAGLALLATVAGLRSRQATEKAVGARRSVLSLVPWELVLLAAAVVVYAQLRRTGAVVLVKGIAQINLRLVAFPLLFVIGAAALAVRIGLPLLSRALRPLGRRWPAWYLAGRRIGSAQLIAAILLAAATTPIAVGLYAATLTSTSQYTLDSKAKLFVGGTAEAETLGPLRRTPQTDEVGAVVTRYLYPTVNGRAAQLIAVDPDPLGRTVFWDRRYADQSLPQLLDLLRQRRTDGTIPALLVDNTGIGAGSRLDVPLGKSTVSVTVVATPRLFPGRRLPVPLLVLDRSQLGRVDPYAGTRTELWTRDDAFAAQRAVTAQGQRLYDVEDVSKVFSTANYVGIGWSFGYLAALAGLVGLVAVGGLLLYLETRQRSRVAAYALGRRMGLTRGTHLRSLLAELGTLLVAAYAVGAGLAAAAVLLVYNRLDVDPARPPRPLLTFPTGVILGVFAGVAVITTLAALYAQRAADRTSAAEVLRLES